MEICSHSLHKNGSKLPELNPVYQHGRHDVTCKPSIENSNGLSHTVGIFFQLVCVGILKALFKNRNNNFPHLFLILCFKS